MRVFLRAVSVLVVALPVLAQNRLIPDPGISGDYLLGPGDVLRVDVFEVEDLSGLTSVAPDGAVGVPLVGRVPAAGLTAVDVEREIERRLADGLLNDPQVSVSIEEHRSQPVSVVGAVKEPGVYQLRGRRRLVDVVALAGGLAPEAGEHVVLVRGGKAVSAGEKPGGEGSSPAGERAQGERRIRIRALLESPGDESANPWIEPHDVVRVEKAGVVYVLGSVQRPGGFPIREQEPMTVLSAVSLAEGSEGAASLQKTRIIRGRGAGKQEIPVRLRDVLKGRAEDVELAPNDIVYIPDSRARTIANRGAEAIVQMATGIVIWRR